MIRTAFVLVAAATLLSGCSGRGAMAVAQFQQNIAADRAACVAGSLTACEAYRIDVERCQPRGLSSVPADPACPVAFR